LSEERRLKKLVAEAKKRKETQERLDFDRPGLLFGPQRAFVQDENHLVVACCSRRGGKTHGIAIKILKTAYKFPGSMVFYITNTRRQAKRVFWDLTLIPLLRDLNIPAHLNQNELTCTLPNGSMIVLGGANDAAEIENYRGSKTPLVVIDEAQSFRSYIQVLVEEIFEWQTMDYNGQIYVTGTPNAACYGYFHDICHGKKQGWSHHHWTFRDNPHLKGKDKFLADLKARGVKETDPKFMRESLGLWVRDTSGLVYAIENENILDSIPDWSDYGYVLGIDFGYTDATAFVVNGYSVLEGKIVTLESYEKTKLIPSAAAEEVELLRTKYDFESIVGDMGGLGKAYGEEMSQRFQIPIVPAEKQRKASAIELVNGDLRTKTLLVYEDGNRQLLEDSRLLQWNYDKLDEAQREGKARVDRLQLKIDDRTPDHLLDAWLYGYRECRAYIHEAPGRKLSPKEAQEAAESSMWERLMAPPTSPWDLTTEGLAGDEPLF
jgi:hypothetical protein